MFVFLRVGGWTMATSWYGTIHDNLKLWLLVAGAMFL